MKKFFAVILGVVFCLNFASYADIITDEDVIWLDGGVGSGNGTLDLLLFTESAGGANNEYNGFDGDNANTDMPTGGTSTADEAFITSIGEIRDYYVLQFPDGGGGSTVTSMGLFVDLNQVTHKGDYVITKLNVVLNYDQSFGDDRDDPDLYDISSSLQNGISDVGYTGGTLLAWLDGPKALLADHGAGWADYVIDLGIDPFNAAYADTDRVLVEVGVTGNTNGGETIFFSGDYIPEPATICLLGLGGLLIGRKRRA